MPNNDIINSFFRKTTLRFVSGFYIIIRCHSDVSNAKYASPILESQILHEDIISLVGFWEKISLTYQSFKDFFDQLIQIFAKY